MSNSQSMNIDGLPAPGDPTGVTVQPLNALTQPLPIKVVEDRYFFSSARNTSFYRTDGQRLIFTNGIFTSAIEEDHKYLDGEIAKGNPYVRRATEEEIHGHKMRVNPRGTIRAEVTAELEADMRVRLEREIMEKLRSQGIIASTQSDEAKIAGSDATTNLLNKLSDGIRSGSGTLIQSSIVGSDKISGIAAGSAASTGE